MRRRTSLSGSRSSTSSYRSDDGTTQTTSVKVKNRNTVWQRIRSKFRVGGGKIDLAALKQELAIDDHRLEVGQLFERYMTNDTHGLSSDEARLRLERDGPNTLSKKRGPSKVWLFFKQFLNYFALLLWAGCALSLIGFAVDVQNNMTGLWVAIVLFVVVTFSGLFSWWQERSSGNVMAKFANILPRQAVVLRNGEFQSVDARDLVVGDVVRIEQGQATPADLRILEATGLKVDNSSLTGESEPQQREVECTHHNPLETRNLAFYGTAVREGTGLGLVVLTGDATVLGRIASLAAVTKEKPTPMQRETKRFILMMSALAISLGILFFLLAFFFRLSWVESMIFAIGIVVANVPEGLMVTITLALTLTSKRMARKNVLCKSLHSVETLGAVSVICSDKTGTLTQNRMTVSHFWFDRHEYTARTSVTPASYSTAAPSFQVVARLAALCNRATFEPEGMQRYVAGELPLEQLETLGDASESAMLRFAQSLMDVDAYRTQCPLVFSLPFNSVNKFSVFVNALPPMPADMDGEGGDGGGGGDGSDGGGVDGGGKQQRLLTMKGAPERILMRCSTVLLQGHQEPLTEEVRAAAMAACLSLAGRGERVIGLAQHWLDDEQMAALERDGQLPAPEGGLTFVGLVSLIDPPREGVAGAIARCHQAGIKVVMVTGDLPATAAAIARNLGIIRGETREDIARREKVAVEEVPWQRATAVVVSGDDIGKLSEAEWRNILSRRDIVFARTSPQQKLIIVERTQRMGHVVAVTGDGVNDAPALRQANIGVAMGIAGTDVSKEAAKLVLLDDNFASIVNGIEEGRLIFDNLKKSVAYTLTSKVPEMVPFLLFLTLGIPLPLSTILIFCVDVGTDLMPALSLAYEPAETDIMRRPPRDPRRDHLVTRRLLAYVYLQIGLIQAMAGIYAYLVVMGDFGLPPYALLGAASRWDDPSLLIHGKNWVERREALAHAQTAYFVSVMMSQIADALIAKTRRLSLFQQGILGNKLMLCGFAFELALAIIITTVPPFNFVFGTRPLKLRHWLPSLPFVLGIILYDELRKLVIRLRPGGWVQRQTWY